MAYGQDGHLIPGLVAGADLSACQGLAVKINSSAQVVLNATDGDTITGVLCDNPSVIGMPCSVQNSGVGKGICGASVTAGARLSIDSASKFITAAAGKNVVGRALAGGSTNDVIPISFDEKGYKAS